ncbi:MAG: hypothetical protein MJE68_21855 [Proteobacteria bacterium]|nr:hypothetical protein [Pseudomonadota bacterium]
MGVFLVPVQEQGTDQVLVGVGMGVIFGEWVQGTSHQWAVAIIIVGGWGHYIRMAVSE